MINLSVIFGTYNRLDLLMHCLQAARESANPLTVEFVIAAIEGDDDTLEFLQEQSDVRLITHDKLHGAARAFDDCARSAGANYVCHLNDDALPLGDCLYRAYRYITDPANSHVGQVALAWRNIDDSPMTPFAASFTLGRYHADFGITRRNLGKRAGWFNPHMFKTYGTDLELSFRIMELGHEIHLLKDCRVIHWHRRDGLRAQNAADLVALEDFKRRWRSKAAFLPQTPIIELPYLEQDLALQHWNATVVPVFM